jgi:hypothetical protein
LKLFQNRELQNVTTAAMLVRTVMDMTNCTHVDFAPHDKGVYRLDLDDAWFELPEGELRDAVVANPTCMICVYHRRTDASLYHDVGARQHEGTIVIKPGGYARWRRTHAAVVAYI